MFDSEYLIMVQADNVRTRESNAWGILRDTLRNIESDTAVTAELFTVAVNDVLADGEEIFT